MARGNTYKCVVCGQPFQFCPKCAITEPSYDAERYCCKKHADIFDILSKHGCHLATAEETLEAPAQTPTEEEPKSESESQTDKNDEKRNPSFDETIEFSLRETDISKYSSSEAKRRLADTREFELPDRINE